MKTPTRRSLKSFVIASLFAMSCVGTSHAETYTVSGSQILKNGLPIVLAGVNAFGVNGPNADSMSGWNISIVREPIGDLSETSIGKPTDSGAYKVASNGTPLHALQDVVNDNRSHGKVTILCPFQWTPTSGQFSGLIPAAQSYQVTVTNTGSVALTGPLSLVLDDLTGSILANPSGVTQYALPSGSPYVSASAVNVAPGGSVAVVLEFTAHPRTYTTRVLAGPGSR